MIKHKKRFGQLVLSVLSENRSQVILATLAMVLFTITQLLEPWPLKIIFDHILLSKPLPSSLLFLQPILNRGTIQALTLTSIGLILITSLSAAFSYLQVYFTSRIGYLIVYALKRELYVRLQNLSLTFHSKTRSGELLTKIISDTSVLKDAFTDWTLTILADILIVLGTLSVMFLVNWRLTLIAFISIPILFVTLYYLYSKIRVSAKVERKTEGKMAGRISEVLTAIATVQVFDSQAYETQTFDEESSKTLQAGLRRARMDATIRRSVEIITVLGTVTVILFGSLQVLQGNILPGELLVFISYLQTMYKPIRSVAKLATKFSKASVATSRISEVLEEKPDINEDPEAQEISKLRGKITFKNVTFSYKKDKAVLKGVSFDILPGQLVALIGPSGAGKSTIISLLLRLYDPTKGQILIDGEDIKKFKLSSLRGQISVVLQDSILFGSSIRENIAYGKPDATMNELRIATKKAYADEFIKKLTDGYDTILAEKGSTLSGGQRQRIAIARALLKDSTIMVFDEPTTGLDIQSQKLITQTIESSRGKKTILVITHQHSSLIRGADQIILLREGRIESTSSGRN